MADVEIAPAPTLLRTFQFRVSLLRSRPAVSGAPPDGDPNARPTGTPLGDGGFQECTGLEVEMDVQEYAEGGRNDGTIRRVGRARYQPIVLKRGMFIVPRPTGTGPPPPGTVNRELWEWLQGVVSGVRPVLRYDGIIEVTDGTQAQRVLATWVFDRGLPQKLAGPQLNARTGEVAIEELHIVHEGLRLVTT